VKAVDEDNDSRTRERWLNRRLRETDGGWEEEVQDEQKELCLHVIGLKNIVIRAGVPPAVFALGVRIHGLHWIALGVNKELITQFFFLLHLAVSLSYLQTDRDMPTLAVSTEGVYEKNKGPEACIYGAGRTES